MHAVHVSADESVSPLDVLGALLALVAERVLGVQRGEARVHAAGAAQHSVVASYRRHTYINKNIHAYILVHQYILVHTLDLRAVSSERAYILRMKICI